MFEYMCALEALEWLSDLEEEKRLAWNEQNQQHSKPLSDFLFQRDAAREFFSNSPQLYT